MDVPQQSAADFSGSGNLTAPVQPRTIWPGITGIIRGFAHEDLPKHLFTVAALHARRALTSAVTPLDALDRATSIGTTVELLAKAALALISPTLIAADREPKSALLYSGFPAVAAHEAKSKKVQDCLQILNNSHSLNFNQQKHSKVFSVRNLALHMGQVDGTLFNEALNIMTRLNETILDVIKNYDSTLDRTTFWGAELLAHVDLRMKEVQEAAELELEELKAAARLAYERLKQAGFSDDALIQLQEREPHIDDPALSDVRDFAPMRPQCPVCGFDGWLGYEVVWRGSPYTELDPIHDDPYHFVDIDIQANQFVCQVCGLDLSSDLMSIEEMGDDQKVTVEATREELDAWEEYSINSYLEDEYRGR
jgi:hypothetical protein